MKKLFALVLALVLALSTLSVLAETTEKKTLIMATNAQFPPYEYYDGEDIVGIDAEIADAIAKYMGYNLKIDDMDFEAIIAAVQTGKADFGMAGMTVTADRLVTVNFSNSYATGVQAVIVKEDSAITCVDDLFADNAKFKIGVQLGTTGDIYVEELELDGKAIVSRFNSGNDAVMALVAGKIDCVLIDNEPAKAYVAANQGLKVLETAYAVEDYAACFAKSNTELLDKFNQALEALTLDGTIPAIIEKYIPTQQVAEEATEAAE